MNVRLIACIAVATAQGASDGVFLPVPPAEALPRPVRGLAAGGFRYAIVEDRLCRAREGPLAPIPVVQRDGTGVARSVAHDPAGTTWLAAEHGLFCTSPEVDVLDPIRLRDGAPPGAPVGVARSGEGRLWLATREAFGCVDARQFFGRTFGEEDGLPPGPYRALAAAADATLLLATESGIFRYAPDQGEPPRVAIRSVDGRIHVPGELIPGRTDGSLVIELEGTALGGPSFRCRFAWHHLWRAIEGSSTTIEGLEPGEHEVHFAAFDRDLRRSDPAVLRVRVPYPPQYSTRFLPPAAAGVVTALLAIALLRSRGGGPLRRRKALLSALLVFVVGLQILAGVVPHGRGWPIVGFSMYTDVYREGDLTFGMTLYGITPSLERLPIHLWDAGEGQLDQQLELAPLLFGSAAERDAIRARYQARLGYPLAGLVVQDERQRLTPGGPVRVAPVILAVHPTDIFDARQ